MDSELSKKLIERIKEVAKKELDINTRTKIKSLIIGQILWRNIIVTTKLLQFELEKLYGRKKRVFYLPPPIPTDYFIPLNKYKSKQSIGLDAEKVHIGYTGRLNPHRKIGVLIDIARTFKKDVEFVFNFISPSSRILELFKKLSFIICTDSAMILELILKILLMLSYFQN